MFAPRPASSAATTRRRVKPRCTSRRSRSTKSVDPCVGYCGSCGSSATSRATLSRIDIQLSLNLGYHPRMRIPIALIMAGIVMQQTAGDRPAGQPSSTRSVVKARNGVIATSQPLATGAGLRGRQSGGNAIDAAVAAAAVLSVVEPTMNGVGGDLFAIVYSARDKKIHGLNASGRAPAAATLEEFKRRGMQRIPLRGELSVSVPGVVDG